MASRKIKPFTVKHFETWANALELDNSEGWIVADYFLAFVEDVFADYPESWLIVPEENAKTTNLAGLVLYHCEFLPQKAFVPWAASARDQALIGYTQAKVFVESMPKAKRPRCYDGYRRIHYEDGSNIQIFAAGAEHADGIIPTLPVIDELHRHRDLGLYRTWVGKLRKRGGQLITISTAGEPGSDFEETREKIRQAADVTDRDTCFGRYVSESVVLHEWAVPEGGDVEDMELVKKANPLPSITIEGLGKKRRSPTMELHHWQRLTCNLPTRDVISAITEAEWQRAKGVGIPEGEDIWLGVDPALKHDSFALVPYWEASPEDRRFGVATILEPSAHDMIPTWKIEQALYEIHSRNTIHTVVLDALEAPGADVVREFCENELGVSVLERGTGLVAQATDYVRFMEALRRGWLTHSGDPGLTRHALNAIARVLPRGDYVFERPVASRSAKNQGRRRIDALDAAAMVHSIASSQHSVYDDRGLIAI